jgi:uncharacterized protein YdeI (YjbR/CyaY-like superfamily)
MNPTFFPTPADLRRWFEQHHETAADLWIGFYKKGSGKPSITWPESVDQALCFGWIDGLRKGIDDVSYMLRFTPRRPDSIWSAVNIQRVADLTEQGLMQPAGLRVFENRKHDKSAVYSFENKDAAKLDEASEQVLRANAAAWEFFQAQAPSYQRAAAWWVISAKKDETRLKRLDQLITESASGLRLAQFVSPGKKR